MNLLETTIYHWLLKTLRLLFLALETLLVHQSIILLANFTGNSF